MGTHPAMLDESKLLADCTQATTRRSGPGGQHRNKVETAVVLTHTPSGIAAEANERRSQEANRRQAIWRLRLRLAIEVRTPASEPSNLWQSRTSGGKMEVSSEHPDFPALVAEALDHLASSGYATPIAAARLGVSGTQLVNLLRKSPAVFTKFNAERTKLALRPLK